MTTMDLATMDLAAAWRRIQYTQKLEALTSADVSPWLCPVLLKAPMAIQKLSKKEKI
jgi:hypothetical protein